MMSGRWFTHYFYEQPGIKRIEQNVGQVDEVFLISTIVLLLHMYSYCVYKSSIKKCCAVVRHNILNFRLPSLAVPIFPCVVPCKPWDRPFSFILCKYLSKLTYVQVCTLSSLSIIPYSFIHRVLLWCHSLFTHAA